MPDREKVIKGLALVREHLWYQAEQNKQYRHYYVELDSMVNDAVAMLKEQENASKRNPVIVCPHCGKRVK